jgi:hypothetical protein
MRNFSKITKSKKALTRANLAAGLTPLAGGRKAETRRQYRSFLVSWCLGGEQV